MIIELDDMKKIILLSMAAAMSFASCQKSEELTTDVGGSSEVVFTSAISTRATGTQWDNGDAIGVFMYEMSNTVLYGGNALYTTSGGESGTFTSSSPLMYPDDLNVDFIAYHPYTTDYSNYLITLNTADQSSEAKVKAQDFMVASAQDCSESSAPSLSFTRKMSKISIAVARKESVEDAELSNILLTNLITDGTFGVVNSGTTVEESSVTAGTTTNNISLFFNEASSLIEAIIVPQEGMSATLKIFIDDEEFETTIAGSFAENKQYSYNLSIGVNGVKFSSETISDWGVNDSGNLFVENDCTTTASEIDAENVPTSNTWTITDSGEITNDLMEGVRAALLIAEAEGRSISISMPNATEIGDYAFAFMTYYDEGVYASSGCPALTEIELPATVTLIGEYAFWGCWDLTTVTLNWTGDEILAYDSSWFMDANKLSKIYIPNGTTADYVAKGWSSSLLVEKAQ